MTAARLTAAHSSILRETRRLKLLLRMFTPGSTTVLREEKSGACHDHDAGS